MKQTVKIKSWKDLEEGDVVGLRGRSVEFEGVVSGDNHDEYLDLPHPFPMKPGCRVKVKIEPLEQ